MRKGILGGLVVLAGCVTPSYMPPPVALPAQHRGVPVTGIIYKDIQIIGPEDYTERMKDSVDRVSQTPFWNFVHEHISTIRFRPPSAVQLSQGIFDTDDNLTTSTKFQPPDWIDSELVHEACHVNQYKMGRASWGYQAEKECIEWQNQYFLSTGATKLLIDVDKMLQKRHWEVKNRWW